MERWRPDDDETRSLSQEAEQYTFCVLEVK